MAVLTESTDGSDQLTLVMSQEQSQVVVDVIKVKKLNGKKIKGMVDKDCLEYSFDEEVDARLATVDLTVLKKHFAGLMYKYKSKGKLTPHASVLLLT